MIKNKLQISAFGIFLLCLFINCKERINADYDRFEIVGYRFINGEKSNPLFKIHVGDIEAIDWSNQSFKISEKLCDSINSSNKFTAGLICEFIEVFYKDKKLYRLNILNPHSSCRNLEWEAPFVYSFNEANIFSSEHWLVIRPIKDFLNMRVYDVLFTEDLFSFFKTKNKINCINWKLHSGVFDNKVNKNFKKDFCEKFSNEIPYRCDLILKE